MPDEQREEDETCVECGDVLEIPSGLTCSTSIGTRSPHSVTSLDLLLRTSSSHANSSSTTLNTQSDTHSQQSGSRKFCAECSFTRHTTQYNLPGNKLCACGLDAADIAERMKRFATEGIRANSEDRDARSSKEIAERMR